MAISIIRNKINYLIIFLMNAQKRSQLIVSILLAIIISISFPYFFENQLYNNCYSELEIKDLKSSYIQYANATLLSDGFNGTYWNTDLSEFPRVVADKNGKIHVVWEDSTNGYWGTDMEIMYVSYSPETGWSNIEVISDGFNGSYWNYAQSSSPAIGVDSQNRIHVVYEDYTPGVWGNDCELMHVSYTPGLGWSNITVISDGYQGIYWNDGLSLEPDIAIDVDDNIHVVWSDNTEGAWGTDVEIMYVKYTQGVGWSNVTVISDGHNGIYWNDGFSDNPNIATDNNFVHVVWQDSTDGFWGTDREIMHIKYTPNSGWSDLSIVSEGYIGNIHNYWNNGDSRAPAIACHSGNTHIVWADDTNGIWGDDFEIMHIKHSSISGWSEITVISDGFKGKYWNDAESFNPELVVDYNDNVHVIWQDFTEGIWDSGGSDNEIMYTNYTSTNGWTNISIISDGYAGIYWNTGLNLNPDLCLGQNNIYVVWQDSTRGIWGTDYEIMFTFLIIPGLMPNIALPFGFYYFILIFLVILGLVYYIKQKDV